MDHRAAERGPGVERGRVSEKPCYVLRCLVSVPPILDAGPFESIKQARDVATDSASRSASTIGDEVTQFVVVQELSRFTAVTTVEES